MSIVVQKSALLKAEGQTYETYIITLIVSLSVQLSRFLLLYHFDLVSVQQREPLGYDGIK